VADAEVPRTWRAASWPVYLTGLDRIRVEQGLDKQQWARRADVDKTMLGRYLSLRVVPTAAVPFKLAGPLLCDVVLVPRDPGPRAWRVASWPAFLSGLDNLRLEHGISKEKWAALADVDRAIMARYLALKVNPYAGTLFKLAHAVECDVVLVRRDRPAATG
jgi:transcriptional regulator with XRE-family HTH domain